MLLDLGTKYFSEQQKKGIRLCFNVVCNLFVKLIFFPTIRFIPQGTVDNNLGPVRSGISKGFISQLWQTTTPLIARHLSVSPYCAWY